MKRRVFFVGAGFSKALCSAYPTLLELSTAVSASFLSRYPSGSIREHYNQLPQGLAKDAEQLLSYLYSDWPWKSSVDRDLDKALYKALVYEISNYLSSIPIQPLSEAYRLFVRFLGCESNKIVTLNYDTLAQDFHSQYSWAKDMRYSALRIYVEDVFDDEQITTPENPWVLDDTPGDGYRKKLTVRRDFILKIEPAKFVELIRSTESAYWTSATPDQLLLSMKSDKSAPFYIDKNFDERILKLHGSIAWHENSNESTIRIIDNDGNMKLEHIPIIIPPVLDKSQHYAIDRLKAQWANAHIAIEQADEIIIIGFSFPITDISCQFLFKSALKARNKVRVIVVNRDADVQKRYDSIFSELTGVDVDYSYSGYDDALGLYIDRELLHQN